MSLPITIVPTRVANLASVRAAFRRAESEPRMATSPAEVLDAAAVLLPGVGSFDAAIGPLRDAGYADALKERIAAGRPTLSICLGMQLLLEGSDESERQTEGLCAFEGRADRFPADVRTPQFGWNTVTADPACRVLKSGYAYFANSYRLQTQPAGTAAATTNHGGPFIAAFERGAVVACQFHPELSGAFGGELLRRWLDVAEETNAC